MFIPRFILRLWHRALRVPSHLKHRGQPISAAALGRLGERLAWNYLRVEHGMKPLYANFRAPKGGEIDIAARDKKILAFIEVKTRSPTSWGRPSAAVDNAKQRLIARGAVCWLNYLDDTTPPFRFDILEIILEHGKVPRFNLIKDAFNLPEDIRAPQRRKQWKRGRVNHFE